MAGKTETKELNLKKKRLCWSSYCVVFIHCCWFYKYEFHKQENTIIIKLSSRNEINFQQKSLVDGEKKRPKFSQKNWQNYDPCKTWDHVTPFPAKLKTKIQFSDTLQLKKIQDGKKAQFVDENSFISIIGKKEENSSIFQKNEVKITFQLPAFMVSQDWKQQIAFRRTLHPSISPRSNATPMTLIRLPLIVASVQKSDTAAETHEVKHEFRDDYRRIARSESYRRIRRRRISHFSI